MKSLVFFSCLAAVVGVIAWRKKDQPWPCLIGKHDGLLVFGKGEIFLRCANCQRRTEGWDLGAKTKAAS